MRESGNQALSKFELERRKNSYGRTAERLQAI